MEHKLKSSRELSKLVKKKDINTWNELLSYVRQLPYGRNKIRTNFSLVITEEKGTCSSKHAFLKAVAQENDLDVKLILCLYKMTENNTPGIGTELTENGIKYIPEAHCYLIVDKERMDLTNEESDLTRIKSDIIEETEISPEQVGEFKVKYHKDYLRNWANDIDLNLSFEEVWSIREKCIANLSKTEKES